MYWFHKVNFQIKFLQNSSVEYFCFAFIWTSLTPRDSPYPWLLCCSSKTLLRLGWGVRGIQNLRTQFYKGQTFSYPTIHWACYPLPNIEQVAWAHHCLFLRAYRGRLSNACTVNQLPFRYTVMWHRHKTITAILHQKAKGIFQNSLKLLAKIMPWRMSWNMSQKMSWNYALKKCPEIMPWQNVLKNVFK